MTNNPCMSDINKPCTCWIYYWMSNKCNNLKVDYDEMKRKAEEVKKKLKRKTV